MSALQKRLIKAARECGVPGSNLRYKTIASRSGGINPQTTRSEGRASASPKTVSFAPRKNGTCGSTSLRVNDGGYKPPLLETPSASRPEFGRWVLRPSSIATKLWQLFDQRFHLFRGDVDVAKSQRIAKHVAADIAFQEDH
jgi:hypothetical protein